MSVASSPVSSANDTARLRELEAAAVSRGFMRLSVVCALIGMGMGIYMGISEDWTLRPVHVHLNLLGWVSCALYAVIYRLVPRMGGDRYAGWHLGISMIATIAMAIAFPTHLYGFDWAWVQPMVSAAFLGHAGAMAIFALLVFKHY
jgi:hypothetical protein